MSQITWFKIDDGFWSHPKSATLTSDAVALWVRAGAYSCQHLTDGFIKTAVLRLLGDSDAAAELVESGLWIEVPGGWKFHDWDEYQETSETVKKRREDARERQRKAREAAEQKRRDALTVSHSESHVTNDVTDSVTGDVTSLPPTRPDPTNKKKRSANAAGKVESIEQKTTAEAYEELGKAFNFMAVRQIVKWAIHDRGTDPAAVKAAVIAIHEAGKPITKQTVDQWLTRSDRNNQRDPKSGLLVER